VKRKMGPKALDDLLRESREHLGTREAGALDWDRVERGLFARIENEQARERREMMQERSRHRVAWTAGAAALAVAAAVALVVGKTHGPSLDGGAEHASASDDSAGTVASIGQDGMAVVDGKPATIGTPIRLGDAIDARGGRVTFERPGKVSWILESGSHATVTHVQGALVLALQSGAVEAQVVPVASGEAFAVDVDGARIAVHGTHLRVMRVLDHITLDLTEGVVSLGEAPRVGSTLGTLITAPAHAEFTAADPKGSLSVTHDPGAVRAALAIDTGGAAIKPPTIVALGPAQQRAKADAPVDVHAQPAPMTHSGATSVAAAAPVAPAPDPNAADALASVVRTCFADRTSSQDVTVEVKTRLHLELDADGNVRSARFEPPVPPDVNGCAAPAIYHARFTHGGSADVNVAVRVPSSAP
jgi:ferric-dicitrate binding protein FerR (iron transport regulator)